MAQWKEIEKPLDCVCQLVAQLRQSSEITVFSPLSTAWTCKHACNMYMYIPVCIYIDIKLHVLYLSYDYTCNYRASLIILEFQRLIS